MKSTSPSFFKQISLYSNLLQRQPRGHEGGILSLENELVKLEREFR